MDLGSECSVIEFLEANESPLHTIPRVDVNEIKDTHVDDCKSKDIGPCTNDTQTQRLSTDQSVGTGDFTADNHVNGPDGIVHLSPSPAKSTTKGYGLKKWRRIKREIVKDPTAVIDGSKVLKRGLSGSENPTKPQHIESTEIKQNSGPYIRPVNTLKNVNVARGFVMHSPGSDSTEVCEYRSSKSSTAASMPQGLPAVLGKKPRAESVNIKKEGSSSSIGSDSRSSNFGVLSTPCAVTSNGKQSGNSLNLDGKNVDEAHEGEDQINDEVQTGYGKENSGEIEELSPDDLAADLSREAKEEKCENRRLSPNQDPLVISILSLRSVQEALESGGCVILILTLISLRRGFTNVFCSFLCNPALWSYHLVCS
ncbi:High mobility group family [Hibiscus syriacus]|uniref:High mobility group family n=1 Tax=Hibiscus syriacus TaxID=106335 RepID=A0A6A2YID4_HIBSY|nr:High mobility group family [Hibiscus syriacus]